MSTSERRRCMRLQMRLPVVIRRRGENGLHVIHATTSNVSTDGFCFETDDSGLKPGDELKLDLILPPAAGVSAFEGRARATGEVLRVDKLRGAEVAVAGRFREPLKLDY